MHCGRDPHYGQAVFNTPGNQPRADMLNNFPALFFQRLRQICQIKKYKSMPSFEGQRQSVPCLSGCCWQWQWANGLICKAYWQQSSLQFFGRLVKDSALLEVWCDSFFHLHVFFHWSKDPTKIVNFTFHSIISHCGVCVRTVYDLDLNFVCC